MKKPAFIFGALLGMLAVGYAQTVARSVMVNTNGVVVSPTNFWANAPISTNAVLTNTSGVMLGVFGSGELTNPGIKIAASNTGFMHTIGPDRIAVVVNGVSALQIFSNIVSATTMQASSFAGGFAVSAGQTISFNSGANIAGTRTNFGLGLPTLTNTSNVTMMRALAGSTNTNHPFSGTVSVVGTNNTNTLTFSNGILQSVQ
jgi:hypothetical protein